MAEGTKISFVTWPNGQVAGESVTIHGKEGAIRGFVESFLPEEWFGREHFSYASRSLWEGARKKGFRVHTIEIGEDGKPTLEKD
jgi:hypothetical protein